MEYNLPLSPSSINLFIDCSYKFFLKYSKKIKLPQSNAQKFGSVVHSINEHFWAEFKKLNDIEKSMQSSIDLYWDRTLDEEYISSAYTCFNNFIDNVKETPKLIPLYTELRCENRIKNTVSIIDAVYKSKIVDYKTTKTYTKKPKTKEIIQAIMCSENLKECFGLEVRNVDFFYVRLNKFQRVEVTDKLIEEVEDTIRDVRSKIKNDEFPKQDNCFKCDYKIICEMEERERERLCKNLKRNTYQSLS